TKMDVNDVEHDGEAKCVRVVHEGAKIVRCSVQVRRGEQSRSVVSPTEVSREFGDRHDFKQCDPNFCHLRQQLTRCGPCPVMSERTDVHFINDLPFELHAIPCFVLPPIKKWIDDLRGTMRTFGLETGCWV